MSSHKRQRSRPLVAQVQARGVDSVGSGFADPAAFVRSLARKEREYALESARARCGVRLASRTAHC